MADTTDVTLTTETDEKPHRQIDLKAAGKMVVAVNKMTRATRKCHDGTTRPAVASAKKQEKAHKCKCAKEKNTLWGSLVNAAYAPSTSTSRVANVGTGGAARPSERLPRLWAAGRRPSGCPGRRAAARPSDCPGRQLQRRLAAMTHAHATRSLSSRIPAGKRTRSSSTPTTTSATGSARTTSSRCSSARALRTGVLRRGGEWTPRQRHRLTTAPSHCPLAASAPPRYRLPLLGLSLRPPPPLLLPLSYWPLAASAPPCYRLPPLGLSLRPPPPATAP